MSEISLGYTVPKAVAERLKLQRLTIAFVARNLWLIHSNVPNIDPEAAYTNGNGQGIEYGTFPINRSMGFTLKIGL